MNRIGIVKNVKYYDNNGSVTTKYAGKTGALTTAISGLSELDKLADGSIALLHQTGALIECDDTLDPSVSPDYIILAVGNKAGVRTTYLRKGQNKCTSSAYQPPVAKVVGIGKYAVGSSATSGLTEAGISVGDEFVLKIVDKSLPAYMQEQKAIYLGTIIDNYTLSLASTKIEALMTDMTAKINAIQGTPFTAAKYYASASAAGIQITANTAGNNFDIRLIEKWAYTTVTTVTANTIGVGTYADMLAKEEQNSQEDGNTNIKGSTKYDVGILPSDLISGTYNILNISYTRPSTHSPNAKSFDVCCEFMLGFLKDGTDNDDGTLWTKIKTIINAYV